MSQEHNDSQVHPELESIIEEAEANLIGDIMESVSEDFRSIEKHMWEQFGDPDGVASAFGVTILADNMGDAMDKVRETEGQVVTLNKPDDIDTDEGGLLGIEHLASHGDMYAMLFSRELIVKLIKNEPVGLIVRVGGFGSEVAATEDVRPSEASDAKDVVVTAMCTNAGVYAIIRNAKTGELIGESNTSYDNVKNGESKMIDAMMASFMAPSLMRDMFDQLKDEESE